MSKVIEGGERAADGSAYMELAVTEEGDVQVNVWGFSIDLTPAEARVMAVNLRQTAADREAVGGWDDIDISTLRYVADQIDQFARAGDAVAAGTIGNA